MLRPKLPLLALILICPPARAQYPNLDPALDRARETYDHAQMTGDRTALTSLLADDYLLLSGSGNTHDKAWLIDSFCAPGVHNNPFTVQKPFWRILAPGTAVVLGGWAELSGTEDGKPFSQKLRFADTWAKRKGHWVVVFTAVAPADKP